VTGSTIQRLSVLASHKLGIIDTDVHPLRLTALRQQMQAGSGVLAYLPERWRNHGAEVSASCAGTIGRERPTQRELGTRWDAVPPSGGLPGSD
jgi:uncharacterized protein